MPVIDIVHELSENSLTITAEFAAPVERIWEIYADPRQLEKIWGPEGYPATVVDHSLTPGGRVTYYMTGPEGEKYYGYWEVEEVEEPRFFRYRDGFADETFTPNPELPENDSTATLSSIEGGTRAVYVTTYASPEALQTVLDMGVVEGTRSAMNQIDALIA